MAPSELFPRTSEIANLTKTQKMLNYRWNVPRGTDECVNWCITGFVINAQNDLCSLGPTRVIVINRTSFSAMITRNSSGDEMVNVNFLHDDIVHVQQNTIDSCKNSATDRSGGYVLKRMFTKFSEITQCNNFYRSYNQTNGHYVVQSHSKSPILVPIESSYTTSY